MGDGGYDGRFAKFSEKYPDIDLAIMENGQYNESWRAVHLMPYQLHKAIDELAPRHVMTYHNAKYKLSVHAWYEPLEKIYQNAQDRPWHLLMPQMGQVVDINMPRAEDPWWREVL